jgi:hypothetical protein
MICDLVGYWASTMVFLTFVTKDMRLLRILAIVSNVAFLSYGFLIWLPPVFCLHLILLPINALRLRQMLQRENCPPSAQWLARLAAKFHPTLQTHPRPVA